MIVGVGNDIIEIDRVRSQMESDKGFKLSVFTATEIEYCESKYYPYQHFAGRFASKEAFFKAIGTGWRNGIRFTDIEIINDELGKPEISVSNKAKDICEAQGITALHVSISHTKKFATAVVIATRKE